MRAFQSENMIDIVVSQSAKRERNEWSFQNHASQNMQNNTHIATSKATLITVSFLFFWKKYRLYRINSQIHTV